MSKFASHEDYIAQASQPLQPLLKNLHQQLRQILPAADEVMAYDMPGFALGGTIVVGYAAFSKQCGIYVSPEAISSLSAEISAAGLKATKTGITFSPDKPIPDTLVEQLVQASRQSPGLKG